MKNVLKRGFEVGLYYCILDLIDLVITEPF